MARIINIGIGRGMDAQVINLAAAVGANGVNLRQDLIIVQALLKYSLEEHPSFGNLKFPEPTGEDVRTTAEIIRKFQRFHNRHNRKKVSVDGRINPIRGKSAYSDGEKLWTLYALHSRADEVSILCGNRHAIEAMCRRWSTVREVLDNSTGSLGLALE